MTLKTLIDDFRDDLGATRDHLKSIDYKNRNIYIFGVGGAASTYHRCFKTENIEPCAFLDNDPSKQGKKFCGVDVIAPSDVKDRDNALVLICSTKPNVNEFAFKQSRELEMPAINLDRFVYSLNLNMLLDNINLFEDDESAETYIKMIKRLTLSEKNLGGGEIPFTDEQYFAVSSFKERSPYEVFADCGAFVGDTIERYLFNREGTFKKIYAFEPTARTFKALSARSERLRREWALNDDQITLVEAGVDRVTQSKYLQADGGSGLANKLSDDPNAGVEIKTIALDDYFAEQSISFLKADIEGYELDMLKGAEKVIRRDRPKMAICIYHSVSDRFRVQQWINNLGLGYKFAVRHHYVKLEETVLYAWQ